MDFSQWQKRLGYIITLGALIMVIFVARLYQTTIVEHDEIVKAADGQYVVRQEVTGERGEIVVKTGTSTYYPLAANEQRYQVLVVPNQIRDAQSAASKLASLLGLNEQDLYNKLSNKKFYYLPPLKLHLTGEEADKVASLKIQGVKLNPEIDRIYPEQALASQVLGFVNGEGKGNYGIEGVLDNILQASSGYKIGDTDNRGRFINFSDQVQAKNGNMVVLSIDREIQHYVEKSLADSMDKYKADGGTVVVMNPKTGAILAMATAPSFNPNEYNKVPNSDQSRFINGAVSNSWEPGSTMKPVVMALAIDQGLVQPDTKDTFGASVHVLNHDIYTAEKKAFGLETMTQVLENSDNVAMVWLSDKLGNQGVYDGLKKFGFGTVPNINLSNLQAGNFPLLKKWNDLTRATISFGQGISITPLQLAVAYSVMANKGVMMQPYVVSEVVDDHGVVTSTKPTEMGRIISEDTSVKIGNMLESVVINGLGKRAQVQGFRIGGKTGTAQVVKPDGTGYYDDRHIGSFAGYFPLSDPQYVVVVKLDNPKNVEFAESSAAPTFGDIASWIISYKQLTPDKP